MHTTFVLISLRKEIFVHRTVYHVDICRATGLNKAVNMYSDAAKNIQSDSIK